jgi:outer membrane protein TolC
MHFLRSAILALAPAFLSAQALIEVPKFPQNAYFRQYFGKDMPRVHLQPAVRLPDYLVGDHLELSLRAYLDLVMANSTDVQISRLTLEQPRNAILRAYSPFDPNLRLNFAATRAFNQNTSALQGATVLSTLNQPYGATYTQTLENGTRYQVGFSGQRQSTNDTFSNFNPFVTGALNFQFFQPLLRNRGGYVTRLPITIAKSRFRRQEYEVLDDILDVVQQAELAYWAVIEARENLKVQEENLRVSGTFLERTKKELSLGAISPLEIYRPQQQFATAEVSVTQARYSLQQTEDRLRRQMGADLDPSFRNTPIVLTETVLPPTDDAPLDREKFVETAYAKRPDLKSQLQALDIDDLVYRQARNGLLPDLQLNGGYTSAGRGGNQFVRTNVFGGGTTISRIIPGGLGDALSHVFQFDFPTYSFGLTLNLPLRDRAVQAQLADAVVNKRLDSLRARSLEQRIRELILNAVTGVESSRANVKQGQIVLDFSQKNLDAEQKRYDLGVTTIFLVLDAQQQKTNAESSLLRASVGYRRALLTLLRQSGQLLEERNIYVQ